MFTDGGNRRTNPTEGLRPRDGAETTGNLLLDFHHTQVAFGQVVVERDAEVRHKAQDLALALLQPQEQVAGLALFAAPALPGHGGDGGVVRQACRQEGLVTRPEGFVRGRVQACCARRLRLLARAFDFAQEVFHRLRPGLVALLDQRCQFAQMMHVAQAVCTRGLPRGGPGSRHGDPVQEGQNANLSRRCRAAFGMRGRVRQVRRTRHVQPGALSGDVQTGLIEMRHRRGLPAGFERGLELRQSRRTGLLRGAERARCEAVAEEIGEQFARARLRQQLIGAQLNGYSLGARPVLHDVGDVHRKGGLGARLTVVTDLVFAAMFGDGEGQHGQFQDLPSFIMGGGWRLQILPAARAMRNGVRLDLSGLLAQPQRRTTMPGLSPHGTLTLGAQAFGLFLEAILRGRLTAVARVAFDLAFQFRDARRQLVEALEQPFDQGDHGLGAGVIHGLDFVSCHRQSIVLIS